MRARQRRGSSLIEMLVVLTIGLIVLLAIFPVALAILREEKGLGAEILGGDALPSIHDKLTRDLERAAGASVFFDPKAPAEGPTRIILLPPAPDWPVIVYELSGTTVTRTETREELDPKLRTKSRRWSAGGVLAVLPGELVFGRLVLAFTPPKGEPEVLVFALPRGPSGFLP